MNENPYTPPASLIEDSASRTPDDSPPPERPRQVVLAVWLELTNWALMFAVSYVEMRAYLASQPDSGWELHVHGTPMLVVFLVLVALQGWILRCIWLGRNWARVTHLLMVVVLPFLFGSDETPLTPVGEIFGYVGWAVEAVVLGLLFLSPGRKWFRRRRLS